MRLKTFREALNRREPVPTRETYGYICTNCHAPAETWSGKCLSCGEWNALQVVTPGKKPGPVSTPKKKPETFTPEVDRAYVVQYLEYRKLIDKPIRFYYKDDATAREFYRYRFDDTYIYVSSGRGYEIKFLIDRVRNVVT